MTDLKALLERVEKAEGPDREIDNLIWWHFFCPESGKDDAMRVGPMDNTLQRAAWARCFYGSERSTTWTASIDAAVALVEKVLPGWSWNVSSPDTPENDPHGDRKLPGAMVWTGMTASSMLSRLGSARLSTPALALCAALLKALIAKGEQP